MFANPITWLLARVSSPFQLERGENKKVFLDFLLLCVVNIYLTMFQHVVIKRKNREERRGMKSCSSAPSSCLQQESLDEMKPLKYAIKSNTPSKANSGCSSARPFLLV